jgi:hypothetical protein
LNHAGVIIGPPQERDPRRQIVSRPTGRHHDRGHEHQVGVDVRRTFLIDERRFYAVLDQGRLVLDRLVHDSIESMIRHHLQQPGHQRVARFHVGVMLCRSVGIGPTPVGTLRDLREQR